jgi:hypothetical protein
VFKGKKREAEIFSSERNLLFSPFNVCFLKEEIGGSGLEMELR